MRFVRAIRLIASLGIASVVSVAIATLVPITAYVALLIWGAVFGEGNLGGPLNFVIIPAGSALAGVLVTALIYVPGTLLLHLLATKTKLSKSKMWLMMASLSMLLSVWFAVLSMLSQKGLVFFMFLASGLAVGMTIQWSVFALLSGSPTKKPCT